MLISLVICEDSPEDQAMISQLIHTWADEHQHQVQLHVYPDVDKLFGGITRGYEAYDAFLLDIELTYPQEGIDLARKIYRASPLIPIIFISSHEDHLYNAFEVNAMHYIAKPIEEERFFSALDRLAKHLIQRKGAFFIFDIEGEKRRFPMYEVIFLTTADHYLLINGDESLRIRDKVSAIVKAYPEQLVMCHQSYAVNLAHIESFSVGKSRVMMSNGLDFPISKGCLKNLSQRFAEYHGAYY